MFFGDKFRTLQKAYPRPRAVDPALSKRSPDLWVSSLIQVYMVIISAENNSLVTSV